MNMTVGGPEPSSNQDLNSLPDRPSGFHRWLVVLLVILAGFGFYVLGTSEEGNAPYPETIDTNASSQTTPSAEGLVRDNDVVTETPAIVATTATGRQPDRTVLASGGFKLTDKSSYSCSAQAPADWSMTSTAQSNTADLFASDKSMYAGYGIQAVNTAIAPYASYYSAPLNDPDLYSSDPATLVLAYGKIIVGQLGGSSDLTYTSETNESLGDYRLQSVASSTHSGVIFYHSSGFPGDGYNYTYAEPMYFAFTTSALWPSRGLLVAQIAGSIRCSTQYQPRDQYVVTAKSDSTSSGSDANGDDDGYNPQLGTEYVHDPGTGENYLVSPSTNWSENGPAGAGYYAEKSGGNDYVKLDAGRSD